MSKIKVFSSQSTQEVYNNRKQFSRFRLWFSRISSLLILQNSPSFLLYNEGIYIMQSYVLHLFHALLGFFKVFSNKIIRERSTIL